MKQSKLSVGRVATLACCLEVAAPKPGNVHRGADFEDVTLEDFLTSAVVLGQVIDDGVEESLGQTIRTAVEVTQAAVGTNTNLGMILLLVPLAKVAQQGEGPLTSAGVRNIVKRASAADAADIFDAIRFARPGGLGSVAKGDLNQDAEVSSMSLREAMKLAADRDLIARQYVNGFEQVFEFGVQHLKLGRQRFETLSTAIVYAHVALMAQFPDSLIARKCGIETAEHSQMLATKAIEKLHPAGTQSVNSTEEEFWNAVSELDFWLRSDGHRRNPGTTADLIAASIFVSIHSGNFRGS